MATILGAKLVRQIHLTRDSQLRYKWLTSHRLFHKWIIGFFIYGEDLQNSIGGW